jgi:glucose-6-phosphate isomerase
VIHNLTHLAGFDLFLDEDTLEVSTGSAIRFNRQARRVSDMKQVLYQPDSLAPDTTLYWTFSLLDAGVFQPAFQSMNLTFGLVLLPAKRVAEEYVKTHGHYHSAMPGSAIGYPEVYTHYFGELYLYAQRRRNAETDALDDCILYRMKPGSSIMIPPGYAHVLINPSDKPALMAGLYSPDAIHEYSPIREMGGAAYFLLDDSGSERAEPNPRYKSLPSLRVIDNLAGSRFAPPDGQLPLWSAFTTNPQRYAFITDPGTAAVHFAPEDLRR